MLQCTLDQILILKLYIHHLKFTIKNQRRWFFEVNFDFQKYMICLIYQPPKINDTLEIHRSLLQVITDYEHG